MADTTTAYFGWTKPDPGGDSNTWGNILNATIDSIDATVASFVLVDSGGNAYLKLNKTASGDVSYIEGDMATKARWQVVLGDASAESAPSNGSNFAINAYDNTGALLSTPFTINRATGICSVAKQPVNANDISTKTYVDGKVAAIDLSPYYLKSGGTISGNVNVAGTFGVSGAVSFSSTATVSGNANVGGTLTAGAINSSGEIYSSYTIQTSGSLVVGGQANLGGVAYCSGLIQSYAGITFPNFYGGHSYQLGWDGYGVRAAVDGGDQGYLVRSITGGGYTGVASMQVYGASNQMNANLYGGGSVSWNISISDRRLKTDIKPAAEDALGALLDLQVYECNLTPPFSDAKVQHWNWALMADEVETLVPSAYVAPQGENGYATLRELPLIAALVRAVQQLAARVEELEKGSEHPVQTA